MRRILCTCTVMNFEINETAVDIEAREYVYVARAKQFEFRNLAISRTLPASPGPVEEIEISRTIVAKPSAGVNIVIHKA